MTTGTITHISGTYLSVRVGKSVICVRVRTRKQAATYKIGDTVTLYRQEDQTYRL